jgi:biotin carboxyl carrier protein
MRVTLVLDGERREVEVDLARGLVRSAGVELPFTVLTRSGASVELEVAGERVTVDGWPADRATPGGPVTVDGERYRVDAELSGAPGEPGAPAPPMAPAAAASAPPLTGADAIVPPMPGKVIEVRVREGDRVAKGAVLLILEAMKMRNEVTAPRDGVVRNLRVYAGTSVKAREPMLSVVAEPAASGGAAGPAQN